MISIWFCRNQKQRGFIGLLKNKKFRDFVHIRTKNREKQ